MFTEEDVIEAINDDNYTALRKMAWETEDLDEKDSLRKQARKAFERCWSYDMMVDNVF